MAIAHIITNGLSTGANGNLLVSWGLGTGTIITTVSGVMYASAVEVYTPTIAGQGFQGGVTVVSDLSIAQVFTGGDEAAGVVN